MDHHPKLLGAHKANRDLQGSFTELRLLTGGRCIRLKGGTPGAEWTENKRCKVRDKHHTAAHPLGTHFSFGCRTFWAPEDHIQIDT